MLKNLNFKNYLKKLNKVEPPKVAAAAILRSGEGQGFKNLSKKFFKMLQILKILVVFI